MIVTPRFGHNESIYDFYTYDPTGRDTIIPIRAYTEDEAYEKFRYLYGTDTIVDQIIKRK